MEDYQYEPHNFSGRTPGNAYVHCVKCGLIMMKNGFSQWAQKVGCNAKYHPSYATQMAKTSPFKEV